MGVSALLFDLDGTLTDPREGITRSLAHALTQLGLQSPPLASLEKYIGPPFHEVFGELLQTQDLTRIEAGIAQYRARYSTVGLFENFAFEGIHPALETLRAQGFDMLLCTSKPWRYAERILERYELRRFFRAVYGPEFDGTRGNKVENLAYLLEREKLDPASCVMIGDRKHDIEAARANGTRNVGVLYGFGNESELLSAGAELICSSPAQLPEVIGGLIAVGVT